MTEADARERLAQQGELTEAMAEFHTAISVCEKQAEHAQDALYKENVNQAHIHFEAGADACDRALRAQAKLRKVERKLERAVPYA